MPSQPTPFSRRHARPKRGGATSSNLHCRVHEASADIVFTGKATQCGQKWQSQHKCSSYQAASSAPTTSRGLPQPAQLHKHRSTVTMIGLLSSFCATLQNSSTRRQGVCTHLVSALICSASHSPSAMWCLTSSWSFSAPYMRRVNHSFSARKRLHSEAPHRTAQHMTQLV